MQQNGFQVWLNAQYGAAETPINLPSSDPRSMPAMRARFLHSIASAPDQLRQKMMYALGQIWVVSANKNVYPEEITPWMKILSRNAFGNYRILMREMTTSPSYGKFLDLANSNKPGLGGGANENYPRELMQLFTIGLYQLNMDGSVKLGSDGLPLAAYDQQTVRQLSLALTGWTYATAPGASPRANNWEYFGADMEPREGNHETSAKLLPNGCAIPAGQTVVQDLDSAINCLFQHPNLPPFVAVRLIRSFTTSNPSPAYVTRVANVFANNGAGVRGDLKATLQAILLDPEARNDAASGTFGRLREPVAHLVSMVRALKGEISPTNQFAYVFENMGQAVHTPNSVFSWFSPLYRIPNTALFGPEFQIYTPTEAALRVNFLYQTLFENRGDITVDLAQFQTVASDNAKLIDAVDQALLFGRMSPQMRTVLTKALSASTDNTHRVLTAVYLTATSGEYAVMH